ncbi:MAG: 16S rRNA (guanine(527)-N(7))-methyltransferase RsmG [Alphaproteobacteria bacterium]|nr:16S rRNA (guanine(527)-N(7))-methyltransferase RsmG [Alphaproteobacteria bacterium]
MIANASEAVAPWVTELSRNAESVAADLEKLQGLVRKWQSVQNLVSRETLPHFWQRHVVDSLQVLPLLPKATGLIFDLGSGGGFPGLPLAIARRGSGLRFMLCESNSRKAAFLRTAIRELALDASVLDIRIETIDSRETGRADRVLARALAPLNRLMELSFPLLVPEGHMVVHKGRENRREIDEAGSNWRFDVVISDSVTDEHGVLLDISHLRPRS